MATAGLSPLAVQSAQAASGTWNVSPTNNLWEASGTETNWSTGAATFPGSTAGTTTSGDVATFTGTSAIVSIGINATGGNSLPLNIGGMTFTGANKSAYVIGSTSGNALWLSSNPSLATTNNQLVISGGGSSGTGNTETVNSPMVLQPLNSTSAGFYTFQNNSTNVGTSTGDALVVNGSVTPGTTTQAYTLTLRGGNTNTTNAVNGLISDGGAALGLGLVKSDGGTWTLSNNDTFTGPINIQNGTLRITGTLSGGPASARAVTFSGSTAGTLLIATSGTVTVGDIGLNQANSLVNVTSGTLIAGSISENAASASRQVTLNGGFLKLTADMGAITGPLNLNGGTLANNKSGGATLQIDSVNNNFSGNHVVNIQGGGGTFDTTLGNITSLALLNGAAGGTVNVTGGNTLKAGASSTGNTFVMSVQGTSTWDINGAASLVAGLAGAGNITNSGAAASLTSNVTTGTQTFAGAIGGGANVSLIKSGAGAQVLSGTSSFTGATAVNAGALVVTGSLTTSATTVNTGGILAGTGNGTSTGLVGSVTIASGGKLQPGATTADGSIGTLTVSSLDATNGNIRFDLVSPGASDFIHAGSATFSASHTFSIVGVPIAGTYTLVQSDTPLAGAQPTMDVPTGTRSTFTPDYGTSNANLFKVVVVGNAKNLTWTGASSNVWNVTGDINWNDGVGSEQFFNLDSVTFGNGAANENITLGATVTPGSMTVNNDTSNNYSISGGGAIAGVNTAVTKSGAGTLVLATNNTYGGGTTINGGVVQVGNGGTAGSVGTGTVLDNGSLVFNRSDTNTLAVAVNGAGSLRQSGTGTLVITSSNNYSGSTTIDTGTTIQLGDGNGTGNLGITSGVTDNGTLIYNRNNSSTISAVVSGSGSLAVNAGTLALAANNTYSGTTTINSGATLQIGGGGTTGSAGAGAITNNGTLAFNRSDNISPASFSGGGAIQQNGTGTLIFSGPSSFTGPLVINSGTVAGLHANAFGSTSGITLSGTGTLSLRGDASTNFVRVSDSVPYSVSITGSGAVIDVDRATVAGTAAKTMTIGSISAATSTANTFTLTFTGNNNTSLSTGDLNGPSSTAGSTVTLNFANTSGTTTLNSYTGNNQASNENLTFATGGDVVITNGINDPPSFWPLQMTKTGNGTLTIKGPSTYSLGTTITSGTVAIGDDNALGFGDVNINGASAVAVLQSADSNTRTVNNNIVDSSTNFTFGGTGNLVFNGGWNKGQFFKNLIVNCPVMTINGSVVSNPGANQGFGKDGPGTLILAGANSYTGDTVVRQGTLTVAPTGSLGDPTFGLEVSNNNTTGPGTSTVVNLSTVNDTTISTLSGFISAPTSGTNTATINTGGAGLNFTVNQTAAFTAPAGIAGAGNFILGSGSTSTLTLTGNLTYTGTTTVNAATLQLQTNLSNTSSLNVAGGQVLLPSNGTFNRVIRAGNLSTTPGSKVNIDNNKMILTAQSVGTWNGTAYTDVTGLIVAGYGVNQDFSGTSGIVTTQSNATGGNTLTNIGVASNADLGLATFGGVSVGANDTLVMYTYGGDANLDGVINGDDYFQIDSATAGSHGWFNGDFNYDGVINGDDYFVIDSNFAAQGAAIPTSGGISAGTLAGVTAVPEPASISLIAAAATALMARRRRRHVSGN